MNRQTIIQNILTNYGEYITEETIIPLIDSGIQQDRKSTRLNSSHMA